MYVYITLPSSETNSTTYSNNPERQAEEGRMFSLIEMPKGATVNYPIGKPLEVSRISLIIIQENLVL